MMNNDHSPQNSRTPGTPDPRSTSRQRNPSGPPPAKKIVRRIGKQVENPYELKKLPAPDSRAPLGSGVIAGEIGEGGMARVYKIWNERLEVFRAVKILLPNMNRETRGRFETESKITAKLHHPNVLEVHNVGDWEGLPFIVMEYIDGVTLEILVKRYTPLPQAVVSAIGVLTARALAYAHNQEIMLYGKVYRGIIHRDLKPQNIMVSCKGELKLMDFGIARPSEVSIHTAPGKVVGTLMYLSPEQLEKDGIDARTDVYSFGAILYELLSGERAFPQKSMSTLLQAKAENSYKPLKAFTPPLKGELAKLSDICMSKDPEKRIRTAEKLVGVCESIHGHTTSQRPEEILRMFIQDPKNFTATPPASISSIDRLDARIEGEAKQSVVSAVLAGFGGLVLVLGLVFLGYMGWEKYFGNPEENISTPPQAVPDLEGEGLESQIEEPVEDGSSKSRPLSEEQTQNTSEKKSVENRPVETGRRSATSPANTKKSAVQQTIPESAPTETNATTESEGVDLEPVKTPPKSRRDLLLEKYKTTEPLEAAEAAFRVRAYPEILDILNDYHPETEQQKNQADLYHLQALVSSRQWSKASDLVSRITMEDAQLEYLNGLILQHEGKYREALPHMENAMLKKSVLRDLHSIRKDALFAIAGLHESMHETTGTEESRDKAQHYWRMVKQAYRSDPSHSRFKLASQKLVDLGS